MRRVSPELGSWRGRFLSERRAYKPIHSAWSMAASSLMHCSTAVCATLLWGACVGKEFSQANGWEGIVL